MDALDQDGVDTALRETDGTAELSRLGANAVLAVSVAAAVAASQSTRQPLYELAGEATQDVFLPLPMVNVISGGAHAGHGLDVQDFLAVPVGATSFAQALEWAWRVRTATAAALEQSGIRAVLVADEGGLGPVLASNRQALDFIARGIEVAGLRLGEDIAIAIDLAATQFYDAASDCYDLAAEQRRLSRDAWIEELASWTSDFPVVSLEDPMAEDDWEGWSLASRALGFVQLLGDDLFATDAARLERGLREGIANAILVKPNQVGTLSDAKAVVARAKTANYATVLSARSGDTEDSWLADLAVAWRTGQIKVGSTTRSERTAKWNRLLRIEAEASQRAVFAGAASLAPLDRSLRCLASAAARPASRAAQRAGRSQASPTAGSGKVPPPPPCGARLLDLAWAACCVGDHR
jgi:enolase